MSRIDSQSLPDALTKKLIFVCGKGGVGKSTIAHALACELAKTGRRTLWITFEDPELPQGEIFDLGSNLWRANVEPNAAFEEYASLKLGVPALARVFIKNKLMRYLSQAAPGMHDLIVVGKVWFEAAKYDHVVVDMPSTGYSLSMFQSTANFAKLFKGGPIHKDAVQMLAEFGDPTQTTHLIVALPEEMPLQEGLELAGHLKKLFPDNPPAFLVNRVFPAVQGLEQVATDLMATSFAHYVSNRHALETDNLESWKEHELKFGKLDYLPPTVNADTGAQRILVDQVGQQLAERFFNRSTA